MVLGRDFDPGAMRRSVPPARFPRRGGLPRPAAVSAPQSASVGACCPARAGSRPISTAAAPPGALPRPPRPPSLNQRIGPPAPLPRYGDGRFAWPPAPAAAVTRRCPHFPPCPAGGMHWRHQTDAPAPAAQTAAPRRADRTAPLRPRPPSPPFAGGDRHLREGDGRVQADERDARAPGLAAPLPALAAAARPAGRRRRRPAAVAREPRRASRRPPPAARPVGAALPPRRRRSRGSRLISIVPGLIIPRGRRRAQGLAVLTESRRSLHWCTPEVPCRRLPENSPPAAEVRRAPPSLAVCPWRRSRRAPLGRRGASRPSPRVLLPGAPPRRGLSAGTALLAQRLARPAPPNVAGRPSSPPAADAVPQPGIGVARDEIRAREGRRSRRRRRPRSTKPPGASAPCRVHGHVPPRASAAPDGGEMRRAILPRPPGADQPSRATARHGDQPPSQREGRRTTR